MRHVQRDGVPAPPQRVLVQREVSPPRAARRGADRRARAGHHGRNAVVVDARLRRTRAGRAGEVGARAHAHRERHECAPHLGDHALLVADVVDERALFAGAVLRAHRELTQSACLVRAATHARARQDGQRLINSLVIIRRLVDFDRAERTRHRHRLQDARLLGRRARQVDERHAATHSARLVRRGVQVLLLRGQDATAHVRLLSARRRSARHGATHRATHSSMSVRLTIFV